MRKYYQEHKEQMIEYTKNWYNTERGKQWKKEYWQKNKEKLYEQQRKYQKKNSKRFSQLCQDSRRRRVERLRTEGCTNAWAVVNGAEPKYKGETNE